MTDPRPNDAAELAAGNAGAADPARTPVVLEHSRPPEHMAADKIECNACPVLCQISAGRAGACDRYANVDGALTRVDPVLVMRRALEAPGGEAALVDFANRADAWEGEIVAREVFVTGVGAGTTYPDYKPAPFIVSSEVAGVDTVTVVTEGIFSYCGVKVKIDTDRYLGPEQAAIRVDGEQVGHCLLYTSPSPRD